MNEVVLTEEEQFRRSFIGKEIKLLDHGFVRVVDYMGRDSAVVQAARVSYGDGTKSVREDKELIHFLMRHHHTTPTEMCSLKLHCKMPIFVARQWIRHRTAKVNEYSGRYSIMKEEFYIPELDQVRAQSNKNKQAGEGVINETDATVFRESLIESAKMAYQQYSWALKAGIAKELARIGLPLNLYTEWYWKIDMNNLAKFLYLRMDSHAQYEVRVFAIAIGEFVKEWLPAVWAAFEQYMLNAVTFSWRERKVLKLMLANLDVQEERPDSAELDGFSKGEWAEFARKIKAISEL